jgi:hypothetical protein
MSEIDDGGRAFPHEDRAEVWERAGMSLRDYFAAKAMQGVFTSPIASSEVEQDYIAMHAYRMADAMIRARGEA